MEKSSGEGESDDGEGSEIVECTERVDKLDEVVEEETGSEEVQHGDDTVEEHGDEEVKHENDDTDTAVHDETETINDSQVRITLDTEQYMNTCICTYNAISVIIITKQIQSRSTKGDSGYSPPRSKKNGQSNALGEIL